MTNLMPKNSETQPLFEVEDNSRSNNLSELVFKIKDKFGQAKLQLGGSNLEKKVIRRQIISPAYTTNWSELRTVIAR